MKSILIIIVLTAAIITGGFLMLDLLDSESQKLTDSLSELEADIEKQNWESASRKLEDFHKNWDEISVPWSMLIDHYEIDNIELVLSQLASYVKTEDKNEALSRMSSLKTFIKHIPEKESFRLKNIF